MPKKLTESVKLPAPVPPPAPVVDHATWFVNIYGALNDLMETAPPPPIDRVASNAIAAMAPLAAGLLLRDKRNTPAAPPAPAE